MRIQNKRIRPIGLALLMATAIISCATTNEKYKQEYARVWKETIKSEAWKLSLKPNEGSQLGETTDFYVSNEELPLEESPIEITSFKQQYNGLVSSAYYKIINEAEKADRRLKEEYDRLYVKKLKESKNVDTEKGNLARLGRKYEAHREMLEGLKSWNIMSEYGTADLEFFQEEHKASIEEMINNGQSEEAVINFLVYKLADLYHFEE